MPHSHLLAWACALTLIVVPRPGQAQRDFVLADSAGDGQMAWAGHVAPSQLIVTIQQGHEPIDRAACNSLSVVFASYAGDGSVGPSPAVARWVDSTNTCLASTAWKLDARSGRHTLAAMTVKGDDVVSDPITFNAQARQLPQIVIGFALVFQERGLDTLSRTQDQVAAAERHRRNVLQPFIGGEFPIMGSLPKVPKVVRYLGLDRLRLFLGATFAAPDREFMFGISALPILFGNNVEDLPLQVFAGRRLQRVTVTDLTCNGTPCEGTDWESRWFVSATTTGRGFLQTLLGRFGV